MAGASVDWVRALAWRLGRHLLDPIGTESAVEVVRRLGAIKAENDQAAQLAVRTRRRQSAPDELNRALADGTLIASFAFRGGVHVMTPDEGAAYLALRTASRQWELRSWQTTYGLVPSDWPGFREAVRGALADGPLTRDELGRAIAELPRYRQAALAFEELSWTLIKALFWQGVMSFGPARDGRSTFRRLDDNPHWKGLPVLDDAGPLAVEAYFRTYGPATPAHVHYWLGEGLSAGRQRIISWIQRLNDRLVEVDVDGEAAWLLSDDLDSLLEAAPSAAVRLLPRHDQWVLGPGTADAHIVPPQRRPLVTRGDNVVIAGGVVTGTWVLRKDQLTVSWFGEAGPLPTGALADEVDRLSVILERPLEWSAVTG